jgi:branched-chain amino acid transport system permease protein
MSTDTQSRRKERIDRGIKVRTAGLYALMSWRELSYLILPRMVLIVGMLGLPMLMPGMYWKRVISIVCIYALLALVFDFLAHFVGLVSLGAFFGTGGYLSALLNTKLGLAPLICVPAATVLGGALCTLLLLPCLPLRGVYFAIVTLMYPLFLARVIEALNILGGTDGIMGIDSFPSAWIEQYLVIVLVLVIVFGLRRLVNTDFGLVLRAVKDNDQAVKASAMNITHSRPWRCGSPPASAPGRSPSGSYLLCGPGFPRLP